MAKVGGRTILRLSDAAFLPIAARPLADTIGRYVEQVTKLADSANRVLAPNAERVRALLTHLDGILATLVANRATLEHLIATGAQRIVLTDWQSRSRLYKAIVWVAYGFMRFVRGATGYGSDEWWKAKSTRHAG